ncbi:flagellar basal body rod protein FlgB [Jeongeupia naejangsanensis]|uniref:Flagellar basal body rod protein FlgB n=1 Tax=Jeongeupia naejangsanensis TaxID=613195 RepID=A0ABS2BI34_9NEIS|nr:flagellar basal body rod protein FlgB [Jeongeupia naejangsanensis]MBM3115261.1 flagellar basal body rod protein FlgB [Jeongeupia naejangsanensis]
MLGRIDDYFKPQETALRLRSERQQVLAANIANVDTPNYKARDFDFGAAFKAAMGNAQQVPSAAMVQTDPRHLQPAGASDPLAPQLGYRVPAQGAIDGNTVEMDNEMSQFADNTLRYQAALTFMQSRISSIKTALSNQ